MKCNFLRVRELLRTDFLIFPNITPDFKPFCLLNICVQNRPLNTIEGLRWKNWTPLETQPSRDCDELLQYIHQKRLKPSTIYGNLHIGKI